MKKNTLKLGFLALVALAIPTAALVACSSDPDPVGPSNTLDAGKDQNVQPDATSTSDAGNDSAPNQCATGLTFDNKRVPGYPNVPQP
jgi:hypothetical protein